ncbi:MAG: hypothetical protein LLG16_02845, partial [Euryarchaeota archaeon]|nr:hypothetical protein [Euryarchaeota archaeon]
MAVYVPVNVSGASDPGQEQVSWITATLDKISQAGSSVSVAVDSEGFVHASYYSEITTTTMYATNVGGTWTTQQVDSVSGRGLFNSIAIDAEDNPWIAYYDSTNKDLLYAKMTTDGWERGVVDEEADVGRYNDIEFNPFGKAAVSYYDNTNEKLKFAMFDDGEFVTETVDDMNLGSTSISFYWDARPVVTYIDRDDPFVKVATKENDTWMFQFVEETSASSVSGSVMTKDDHLAVVYRSTDTGMMRFGELISGAWSNINLNASVSASSSISLAADDEGSYHISYYSSSDSSLVYMNDAKGWWESQVLDDTGEAGIKNAIAVNEFDRISVIYIDGITQHLKFITNDKATWKMFVVDNEGSQIGTSSDMTVDFDGNTHVVYYDGTSLLYYTDQDGDYQHVLDANAGMNPSIAVDLDGNVYVSYYDETNQYLKFAALRDGSWTTRIVDSSIGVGTHSSVAVSSSGNITIVYTDDQEQKLKYVSGKANSWTGLLYIDDSGLVDVSSEIDTVYANNGLHVSYVRSQSLYHAERVDNVWSDPEMIDDASSVEGATSIASNDDGLIFISYHVNGGTKGLKLATFDDAWTTQWVVKSDSYDQGVWNSLNVDTAGQPQIAYSGPDG